MGGGAGGGPIHASSPSQLGPFSPLYLRKGLMGDSGLHHHHHHPSTPTAAAAAALNSAAAARAAGGAGGHPGQGWPQAHPLSPYFPSPLGSHHHPALHRNPFLNLPGLPGSYLPGAPSFQNLLAHLNVAAAAQQLPPGHPLGSLNAAEFLLQHSMAAQQQHHQQQSGGGSHSPIGPQLSHSPPQGHLYSGVIGGGGGSDAGRKSGSNSPLGESSNASNDASGSEYHHGGDERRSSSIAALRVKAREHEIKLEQGLRLPVNNNHHSSSEDLVTNWDEIGPDLLCKSKLSQFMYLKWRAYSDQFIIPSKGRSGRKVDVILGKLTSS